MKLIDKAAVVAEIERKMNLCKKILLRSRTRQDDDYHQGNIEAYEVVISLLDTLEVKEVGEEPTSNDLEKEIQRYYNEMDGDCRYMQTARHFARWQKQQMIDKACDWLADNIDRYLYNTGGYEEYIPKCGGKMFEDFKKAMEE